MSLSHAPKKRVGEPVKYCVDVFAAFGLLCKNSQKYKKYQSSPNGKL
jgi:hypothetical protein